MNSNEHSALPGSRCLRKSCSTVAIWGKDPLVPVPYSFEYDGYNCINNGRTIYIAMHHGASVNDACL